MYTNSSSDYSSQTPPVDQSIPGRACASFSPVLHHLYGWTKMPSMATKAAKHQGLPDQPDHAGMRERRKQSEMTLTELQRSRGIQPPENPHAQILDAYGYRQLADLIFSIPRLTLRMLNAIGDTMTFRIGPPGADAAPVGRSDKSSGSVKLSTADFIKKYSSAFEIWLNPSAKNAANMKGTVFLIGEDHFDESIQKIIKEFMLEFSRPRGDRVFIEGAFETGCKGRIPLYQIEKEDCQPLESNSTELAPLSKIGEKMRALHLECVHYLRRHIPATRGERVEDKLAAVQDFLKRRAKELPVSARNGYNVLIEKINSLSVEMEKIEIRTRTFRDDRMSAVIRLSRTRTAWNFAIVGAAHLAGLRERLQDLPCIFMIPHGIVATVPSFSLKAERKQEL